MNFTPPSPGASALGMIGFAITPDGCPEGIFAGGGINDRPPQRLRSPEPVIDTLKRDWRARWRDLSGHPCLCACPLCHDGILMHEYLSRVI